MCVCAFLFYSAPLCLQTLWRYTNAVIIIIIIITNISAWQAYMSEVFQASVVKLSQCTVAEVFLLLLMKSDVSLF